MKKLLLITPILIFTFPYIYSQDNTSINIAPKEIYITTTDSVRLFVKVSGKGPICFFIHGGPGGWSKSFEEMGGNNLEKELTMVYYDQRGCGRSDTSKNVNYTLDRMVEDIENIRRNLGANKLFLLSHSFGGIIATGYTKKYPEYVRGLILANATLDVYNSLQQQIAYINVLTDIKTNTTKKDSITTTFFKARQKLIEKKLDYKMLSEKKSVVDLVNNIDRTNPSSYAFSKKAWSIKEYFKNYSAESRNIKTPVLIITGTKDYSVGINHYKLFQFPNQNIVSIKGGHLLYCEKNSAFTQAIFTFVKTIESQK